MKCYKCGLELSPLETACPRCARHARPLRTGRLPDLSSTRTQHLVQLEQCPHCRMLLFPADAFCPSCGAPVPRTPAQPVGRPQSRASSPSSRWVVVGVAVSVLLIAAFLYALRHL